MAKQAKTARSAINRAGWDMQRANRAAMDLRKLVTEAIGAEPIDADDAALVRDTIEGEIDIVEVIQSTVEAVLIAEAEADAIEDHIDRMQDRKRRIEARAERLRGLIHQAMATAEIGRLPLPIATLTRRPSPAKVVVTDESVIPASYFRTKEPEVDRKALMDALKAIEAQRAAAASEEDPDKRAALMAAIQPIPGAELSNGGESLQIRSS